MSKSPEVEAANGHGSLPDALHTKMVGMELHPFLDKDKNCIGAAISLVASDGKGGEDRMAAQLGPHQLRELAARALMLADASDPSMKASLVVTKKTAWIPGQVLQVRMNPDESFHHQFLLASPLAVPEKPKLILPG